MMFSYRINRSRDFLNEHRSTEWRGGSGRGMTSKDRGLRWDHLLDHLLEQIFSSLPAKDLARVAGINRHWYYISRNDRLWKDLFEEEHSNWREDQLKIAGSYFDEYVFFKNDLPKTKAMVVDDFETQLTSVSFSSNGKFFGVCGANAMFWLCTTEPLEFFYEKNLGEYLNWRTADGLEFSPDEQRFIVNGIRADGKREFASFNISPMDLSVQYLCRVLCTPEDFKGCWFDNQSVISGELYQFNIPYRTAFGNSISQLWLCSVPKDKYSVADTTVCPFVRFLNRTGCVKHVMVAQRVSPRFRRILQLAEEARWEGTTLAEKLIELKTRAEIGWEDEEKELTALKRLLDVESDCSLCYDLHKASTSTSTSSEFGRMNSIDCTCTCHHPDDRLLIYVTGGLSERLNFKMITPGFILKVLNMKSIEVDEEEDKQDADGLDYVLRRVHHPDHYMEMGGSIHGIQLSADHKVLMVSLETVVEDDTGHVIGTQLEHRQIDLGKMIIEQRPSFGKAGSLAACTSENFIISVHESEVTVWSRDYGGEALARLQHPNKVNHLAVHPRNSMILSCVGKDLHIWMNSS